MASGFEEAAELAQDKIKEELSDEGKSENSKWVNWVGLSTMIMALLVAIGALLVHNTTHELMIQRTQEIVEISYMEADRIDIELLKSRHAILTSLGETVDELEVEKIRKFQDDRKELAADILSENSKFKATKLENKLYSIGVTLLSIGLTLSGMSVIMKRKLIWIAGIILGGSGIISLGLGLFQII